MFLCFAGSLLYAETPAPSPLPSFTPSLFSHVPPSINFCQYNEKTVDLPVIIGRLLKWRFTNITPLIVRKTITNSGFKITKSKWLLHGWDTFIADNLLEY